MYYDFAYYSGEDLVRPTKPVRPSLAPNASSSEIRAYAGMVDQFEKLMPEFVTAINAHRTAVTARGQELQKRLCEEYNLTNEEFHIIWHEAYNRGSGYQEIVSEFESLHEFVEAFNGAGK